VLPTTVTAKGDLPQTALVAYQRAALVLASAKPGCHLDWSVLAALGQVESDHGRAGGATLAPDGTSSPAIRGEELDGQGSARVPDTDGGQIDGDASWDRAVGPMHFLPSTWMTARADGDGDGQRSPDDLDDSSLAAAVYLCAWGDDLATPAGLRAGIHRYHQFPDYVSSVISLAAAYRSGTYLSYPEVLPGYDALWTTAAGPLTLAGSWAGSGTPAGSIFVTEHVSRTPRELGSVIPGTAEISPTKESHQDTSANARTDPPTPAPSPWTQPATNTPTPPDPSPVPDLASDAGGPSPVDLAPTTGEAEPSHDPAPRTALSGTLSSCGDGEYCIDGSALGLGRLGGESSRDYDGDGAIETCREELDGLIGTHINVEVDGAARAVQWMNGLPWQ